MKIECTLPNASEEISGIKFVRTAQGTVVSADAVDPKVAARLLKIAGYREYAESGGNQQAQPDKESPKTQTGDKGSKK